MISGSTCAQAIGVNLEPIVIILLVVATLGIGIAIRFLLVRPKPAALPDKPALQSAAIRLDRYRVMARLFCAADAELAETHPLLGPVARDRLVACRRRIMRLYLRELRHDFSRFFAVCRMIARQSDDPDFGMRSLRLSVAFHVSWATLWLQTYTTKWEGVLPLFDELVGAVQLLRNHAAHSEDQRSQAV